MKLHFKLKIAVISLAVSGALLTGFGLAFFGFVYHSGIERMDREIRMLAESSMHGALRPGHWFDFDNSLQFIYGQNTPAHIALLVVDAADKTVFKSENAPEELIHLPRPELSEPAPLELYDFSPSEHASRSHPERTDLPPHRFPPPMELGEPPAKIDPVFYSLKSSAAIWRAGVFNTPQQAIVIAMNMATFYAEINRIRLVFLIAIPAGLILLGIAGWFLAARAMRPVAVIAGTAENITAKDLNQRIPAVGNNVELERLVSVFNKMLERLEKSYHQAVRFSADAAHELQTPLTILQGELDNAINTSQNGSREQQRYSKLLAELSNLKAVVQKLLLLSHADEGRLKLNPEIVNLSEMTHAAVEDLEFMAPKLKISTEIPDEMHVSADPALLNQILRNMISNAAKYTAEKGQVRFKLTSTKQDIRLTLSNSADPIPAKDRNLLFDRFHRVDTARGSSGSGLGLSLARELARAHGGDLTLNPAEEGIVSFTLRLPHHPA